MTSKLFVRAWGTFLLPKERLDLRTGGFDAALVGTGLAAAPTIELLIYFFPQGTGIQHPPVHLPDQRQRLVLSLRYLDGLSWREIAEFFEDTGEPLCERQLYRIHKAALAAVAELDLQPEPADDKMEEE